MEGAQENKRIRASKKVQEVKKFNWYVITSTLASLMTLGMAYFFSTQNAPDFLIAIFLFAPFIFVVVGVIYYFTIFDRNPILVNRWEERQVQKYIEQERSEAEKYR